MELIIPIVIGGVIALSFPAVGGGAIWLYDRTSMTNHKIIVSRNYTTFLINPVSVVHGDYIKCHALNFNGVFMRYLISLLLFGNFF